ncbi:hypothetical protein HDR66_00950, partial [bacterium]|nr:hypothetical protein [bacterium]
MKKTVTMSAPTTLSTWIWRAPARFAIFMAIITFSAFTIVALGGLLSKGAPTMLGLLPATLIPLFAIFLTVNMLRRLNTTDVPMDRQSFITASTIMEIINRPINLIFGIIGIYSIAYFSSVSTPGIMSVLIPLIISLLMFYCLGVWICNMYLTYLRARTMGVSKLCAILSMPF